MKDRYLIDTTWSTSDVIYGSAPAPSYKLTIESLYVYIPVSDEQKMRNKIKFFRRTSGWITLFIMFEIIMALYFYPPLIIPFTLFGTISLAFKLNAEREGLDYANNNGSYVLKDDPTLRS